MFKFHHLLKSSFPKNYRKSKDKTYANVIGIDFQRILSIKKY